MRESCEIQVSQKLKSRMALTYFFCHSCYIHVTLVFHNSLSQCVLHNGYCSVLLMHSVRSVRHNAKLPEHTSTSTSQKIITYKYNGNEWNSNFEQLKVWEGLKTLASYSAGNWNCHIKYTHKNSLDLSSLTGSSRMCQC